METQEKQLKTLIPLEDFKAMMGIDDREDRQARFCFGNANKITELVTALIAE